jgi:FkbM family methyltransferase
LADFSFWMTRLFHKLRGKKRTAAAPACGPEVFLTPDALAINEARLCHLASLGLDLGGKKVLEVGGGIGLHTGFFESLGCDVTFTDGRADNVAEVNRRYPRRKAAVLDLDRETDLTRFGQFDIVYCYGLLYHLSQPAQALRALSAICREMILVETCVTPGDTEELHPEAEPAHNPNQAASGLGCRPTRPWVLRQLREHFGHGYVTVTQPLHPDFELNWVWPAQRKLYRSVFVGAKRALTLPSLSEALCQFQNTVPDPTRGVWLDVGAHLGETTFEHIRSNRRVRLYAFEPNLELAAKRWGVLPNYTVVPMAVADRDGFASFHLNANSAVSSLLPFDDERLRQWVGGEDIKPRSELPVPTIRLDTFLNAAGIEFVDYLKIDTQGGDFAVVQSAGPRLPDIRKIRLEVTVTPTQLYRGAATKENVIQYLTAKGFALVTVQSQTHGQEENLTFFKVDARPSDLGPVGYDRLGLSTIAWEKELKSRSDEVLLELARSIFELHPLVPVPGWYFGSAEAKTDPPPRLRRSLWKTCAERKLQKPIVVPWYEGTRINLYLGNDMSCPTFIGGCIEPNEFAFLSSVLKPGMVMIDVGANDGFFTVLAAKRVGESGRVYSFEPSQREFARLNANRELNQFRNIRPVAKALAEANGTAQLRICEYGHEGQNTLGDFAHQVNQAGSQAVELCTLDDYLAGENLPRLDLIKIDAEGAEHRVLLGARKTLSAFKPIILVELLEGALRHQGSSPEAVIQELQAMGYLIYDFSDATGRPVPSQGPKHSDNIIATPRPLEP